MCVCERTKFSVSWKSLGDGVWRQRKNLFHSVSWKRLYHYGFEFKRPVYQVSRRLQCLHSKLCGAYLVFFWIQIGKRIRSEKHYRLLYMGLQIQQQIHLRLQQGKTIKSEKNTRRFWNVEQFTRSVRSIQSSMVDTYENGNFSRRNWCVRTGLASIGPGNGSLTRLLKTLFGGLAHFDYIHCMMRLEEFMRKQRKDLVTLMSSKTVYLNGRHYLDK